MLDKKDITGIILAGGKSSRMGSEKGFVKWNSKPFIQYVIEAVKPLVKEIVIVSNNKNYDEYQHTRISDLVENSGPLAGLYTGLNYSSTEYNLVLSCDVPLIQTKVLKKLIAEVHRELDIVLLQSNDKATPLVALYKKQCAVKCLELLEQDERRVMSLVKQSKTKIIILDKSLDRCVKNINTPEELKEIENESKH